MIGRINIGDSVSLLCVQCPCTKRHVVDFHDTVFRLTNYRGIAEGRDCVTHAARNFMFLLLGGLSSAYKVSRLHRSITLASVGCLPHTKRRPEFGDLLKSGHFSPVFQNTDGHLGIKKW